MRKIAVFSLVLAVAAAACSSQKADGTKKAQASPTYKLAVELAKMLPIFDPEKNAVLITAEGLAITVMDVLEFYQGILGSQTAELGKSGAERLRSGLLQAALQLGTRKLIVGVALDAKTSVSAEELNKAMAEQYAKMGGEAKFLENLKKDGMDIAFVKKTTEDALLVNKFLEKTVFAAVEVTDVEILKAYQEDKTASVRHILLLTQGKTEAEKAEIKKKMEGLQARAKKGEDFAALAKEFSEDSGSKAKGGLYENFGRGKMTKPFEDAAFSVPVGQISGVVETTYGFHILKVENRKKESEPLEKVKARLKDALTKQKKTAAYEVYLAELKRRTKFTEVKF